MKFIDQHTLKFSMLSPLHIGCDETYEPTNYVIDEDALYEFDPHRSGQSLPPKERQNLLTIASGRPNQDMLKRVQSFFHQNREVFMLNAVKSVPVNSGVVALYNERIGKTAQHEGGGRQVINKLVIERTSYTPATRKPYLPGSSIKGAIRTALLDRINGGRRAERDEKNRDLQQRLFQYSMRELHKDPMRLVSVADAHGMSAVELPVSEICFAVNRKKHPVKVNGKAVRSQAEQRGLYQLLECIPAFCHESFPGTINFQSALSGHDDKLPVESLRWNIEDIADACNRFYRPLLEAEMELLAKQNYLDPGWMEKINELLNDQRFWQKSNRFIMRVGRHSGAETMTLDGVRNIKIMQGRNEKPKFEKESKTVWLASSDKDAHTGLIPFGWVLVEVDSTESDPAVFTRSESNDHLLKFWQAKTSEKVAGLLAEHEKRIAAQRAEEERERLAEQEESRRQQILEEKLRSLTPLARDLETQAGTEKWESDKDAFWKTGVIESWLTRLEEEADRSVIERLVGLFDRHFPGALKEPDKTQGKKQKPVFGDRVRQAAKTLNALRAKP